MGVDEKNMNQQRLMERKQHKRWAKKFDEKEK